MVWTKARDSTSTVSDVAHVIGGGPSPRASYYTHVEQFVRVRPESLLTGRRYGTNISRVNGSPRFKVGGEVKNMFDPDHGAWPRRMKYWGGVAPPSDFASNMPDLESRFYEFHAYDISESTETAQNTVAWMKPRFLDTLRPSGTVVTLMGMSACGKRVAVHVFGVHVYFFVNKRDMDAAAGISGTEELKRAMVDALRNNSSRNQAFRMATPSSFEIEVVRRKDLYYFETEFDDYYMVRVANSRFAAYLGDNFYPGVTKYEVGIDAITRLILDHGLTSFGWFRFVKGSGPIQIRHPAYHYTSADIEVNCTADNLEVIDRHDLPDYKLLSFDIECKSGGENDLTFPSEDKIEDLVIQISAVGYSLATRQPEVEILFTLGSCALRRVGPGEDDEKVVVCECESEIELLLCFMTFVKQYSPEMDTGYNVLGFDWPFIYNKLTGIYGMRVDGYGKFNAWGTFKVQELPKTGFGKTRKVKINGMITIDALQIATEKLKLPSYRLNVVAHAALGEGKVDLQYSEIPVLFAKGAAERGEIGHYCLQDSRLVGRLFFKFLPHLELSAVAKLACIPLSRAVFDGQQIRVLTCLLQRARKHGFVLPSRPRWTVHDGGGFGSPPDEESEDVDDVHSFTPKGGTEVGNARGTPSKTTTGGRSTGYQGAKVLDPDIGFHVEPVMVFDFASLYPSIMQSNNLCYTTLTYDPQAVAHLTPERDYIRLEIQERVFFFVREHVRKSLLGDLLTDWLMMRKSIRERIKTAETEEERVLLDKQQLAIKIVCNSVYGFTGVKSGLLPCLEVASAVTYLGRSMLLATKAYVETHWADRASFRERFPEALTGVSPETDAKAAHSVRVIYGDTDSVFIEIKGVPIDGLVRAGERMADEVTRALFRPPVKLECEKTFSRLLMIAKKKYIGIIDNGKMLMKGVDMVRKTNCKYVTKMAQMFVDKLFRDDAVAEAAAIVSATPPREWEWRELPVGFSALEALMVEARDRIHAADLDVREFVMTTELSRAPECYVNNKISHLTVYRKRVLRGEQIPQVKDRIEYVIAAPGQRARDDPAARDPDLRETDLVSSRAEDPVWLERKGLALDIDYYFANLIRTLSVMFNALFKGDTRTAETVLKGFIRERFEYPRDMAAALTIAGAAFRPLPPLGRGSS